MTWGYGFHGVGLVQRQEVSPHREQQRLADYLQVPLSRLREDPKEREQLPEEIVILNRAAKKMTPENRKKLLDMARIMFQEEFAEDE